MAEDVHGVLQVLPKGGGYLRDAELSFQPLADDVHVSVNLIRQFGLITAPSSPAAPRSVKRAANWRK